MNGTIQTPYKRRSSAWISQRFYRATAVAPFRIVVVAVAAALLVSGCMQPRQKAQPSAQRPASLKSAASTVVTVAHGKARGEVKGNALHFYGLPYAAPPIGDLRWASPASPAGWEGIRDATTQRTACAPKDDSNPAHPRNTNEDCLWVNVTVPAKSEGHRLPVMVWLHGGGLQVGSANDYDPSRMVDTGRVMVVTVESRINVMGYFAHPGLPESGTFGLQDEQAALRWVRQNAKAFGGDPGNVTLFGESGGAARTCAHLTSPRSAGLFDKAILQSGGCSISWPIQMTPLGTFWTPRKAAEARGRELAIKLGCSGDDEAQIACLRRVPVAKLLQEGAAIFGQAAYGTSTLPQHPMEALQAGNFAAVPILSGSNRDEGRAFVGFARLLGTPIRETDYANTLRDAFGEHAAAVHRRYPGNSAAPHPDAPALAWASVITDRMFVCPQLHDMRLISAKSPVWGYSFDDPHGIGLVPFPPDFPSGASHSGELPLLFELAGAPVDFATQKKITPSIAQRVLADTMIRYWTGFAYRSDPNAAGLPQWPALGRGTTRPVLRLIPEPGDIEPVNSSPIHQCDFWAPAVSNGGPE